MKPHADRRRSWRESCLLERLKKDQSENGVSVIGSKGSKHLARWSPTFRKAGFGQCDRDLWRTAGYQGRKDHAKRHFILEGPAGEHEPYASSRAFHPGGDWHRLPGVRSLPDSRKRDFFEVGSPETTAFEDLAGPLHGGVMATRLSHKGPA